MSEATRQFFEELKSPGEGGHEAGPIANWWNNLHIGDGHADAMLRAGMKELTQAFVPLPDSNIRPVEEPGLFGNLTPQEIVQGKAENEASIHGPSAPEQERSTGREM